jgi:hypothetical protein
MRREPNETYVASQGSSPIDIGGEVAVALRALEEADERVLEAALIVAERRETVW